MRAKTYYPPRSQKVLNLINRFEDNSFAANVVIRGDSSFGRVVDSRSAGQKRKLEAKRMILAQLQKGIEKK